MKNLNKITLDNSLELISLIKSVHFLKIKKIIYNFRLNSNNLTIDNILKRR